ncbi:glycosyltransferase [Rhodococcus chondri]|uniref:Glycosyltransferase family 2 protein n=1 Tax=Rhodococcus chondri TaxID=3065941 RepID=A0ABU7JS99_9NOCA|nr:glycosyltransferase family 2 protein [Rhodococcus sp. CC-R104]MEE2032187.1 glycosyltransferase family 2 protein [Rhodococcus sp. CC-R104]
MSKTRLSVVIPVFNEEEYIGSCLRSLLAQEAELSEIIVVDNNSTDSSREIIQGFVLDNPKVRLLCEPNPGVAHARNRGFEAATGDVFARIDADTRVSSNWARAIIGYFDRDDTASVGGITGLNDSYDSPYRGLEKRVVDWQVERGILGGEKRLANLHGANMAIRARAWERVRERVSADSGIHEDFDLGICLTKAGFGIAQLDRMRVEVSPRRAYTSPVDFMAYTKATLATGTLHGVVGARFRLAVAVHWLGHLVVWLAYRPYDPATKRFSARKAFVGGGERSLPVAGPAEDGRRHPVCAARR